MAQGAQTGPLASSGESISQKVTGNAGFDPTGNGSPLLVGGASPKEMNDLLGAGSEALAAGAIIAGNMSDGSSITHMSGANNIVPTFRNIGFDSKGQSIMVAGV
jgi:hypothetical protein